MLKNLIASFTRLLPGNRTPDSVQERMTARREAEIARIEKEAADRRHAFWSDERDRLDYYTDSRGPFWLHYVAIGKPPFGSPEERACWPEPPTRAQWAKLTPAQKADTVNPVLPEDLPA